MSDLLSRCKNVCGSTGFETVTTQGRHESTGQDAVADVPATSLADGDKRLRQESLADNP